MNKQQHHHQAGNDNPEFGQRIGILTSLFGCKHQRLGRPFTFEHVSYRACMECGARQHFDLESWTTYGGFYYPPEPGEIIG
ncbi:MAG: hypothetical protein R2684_09695 [Pyrinomonadaceae bacterium]